MPHATFSARVGLGKIGANYGPSWCSDIVFTSSLFAVMFILMQSEATVTRALIGTNGVLTHVLTAAIVGSTLVFV